jgi:hypothetical protein
MESNTFRSLSVENMEFCAAAIVQSAHDAIVEKHYGGKRSVDPLVTFSLVLALHKRVREAVGHVSLTMSVGDIDWQSQVLEPTIANFHVISELGISAEDAQYLMLLGTIITLGYETLLIPEMQQHKSTCAFLTKIFADYLCEPEIHHRITERLQLEQRRLAAIGATSAVQGAVRIVAWEKPLPEPHVLNTMDAQEDNSADSRPFPRDLHIAISLKPDQSLPFEFVECIGTASGNVVAKTRFGLQIEVQPGFQVSDISGMFDAVTISVDNDQIAGFAATIIVSPGYAYRATNVESVFEVETQPHKTVIETLQASFEVSHGAYLVKRRNCHRSVLIESTEC